MKEYDVTIKATVTKVIRVEAENEDMASEEAHQIFNIMKDGYDEEYDEETVACDEVEPRK